MKRLPSFNGLFEFYNPLSVEDFLQSYWGKSTCYSKNLLGDKTSDLLSLEEFEFTIAGIHKPHEGWLHLSNHGLKRIPDNMLDADGLLRMPKIRAAFAKGESLYLTKGEKLLAPVMQLCRMTEINLSDSGMLMQQPINAHVFLTPPHSQAFPVHRDEHASFILQIEGSKQWTIYESTDTNRTAEGGMMKGPVDEQVLKKLSRKEYQLNAGDVLYVPEWWPHEARSSADYSLHITLRMFPLRYSDILETIMVSDWKLQEYIDTREVRSHSSLLSSLLKVINGQGTQQRFENNFGEFVQAHLVPDKVLPGHSLRQTLLLPGLTLQTPLVRPAGNKCLVMKETDSVCIRFPGGLIRGPEAVSGVFEFVARETRMRPFDLPDIPGLGYDKVDFARTMISDGLLDISFPESTVPARKRISVFQ